MDAPHNNSTAAPSPAMTSHGQTPDDNAEHHPAPSISASRLALRNFTSQWFLVPQGTGILAVILHQLDYQFMGLAVISQCLWVLTIALLICMLAIYAVRVAIFPSFVCRKLKVDIMEAACLSSISIAFTTIIQMIALNLVSDWSTKWGLVAYGLWWVNVTMATAACIGITYIFTRFEPPGVANVSMAILLPPIAALTAAAGGAVICRYGKLDAELQVPVILVSYLLVGLGLPLSLVSDALFVVRVYDGSWPGNDQIYSLMILCGPLGQSSFALLSLGDVVTRGAFANYNTSTFLSATGAPIVAVCSQFLGIITWGFGTFWHGYACIAVLHSLCLDPKAVSRWDQHLGSWALVFPWGVYTNAAVELGVILNSRAFDVWSTVLAAMLVLLWFACIGSSIKGLINGRVLGLDGGWRATHIDEYNEKNA